MHAARQSFHLLLYFAVTVSHAIAIVPIVNSTELTMIIFSKSVTCVTRPLNCSAQYHHAGGMVVANRLMVVANNPLHRVKVVSFIYSKVQDVKV